MARRQAVRGGRGLIVSLWVIGVLAVLFVGADRGGKYLAERVAAKWLAGHARFTSEPDVTVHGIPFLTQAIGGHYDDIEVAGGGLTLGQIAGATLDAHLHGVTLPPGNVIAGSVKQLPCNRIDGVVTIPYSELASLSGVPGLTLSKVGDRIAGAATIDIPGIPIGAPVTATVHVAIAANALHLSVTDVTVAGISPSAATIAQLNNRLATPIEVPALPYGLVVTSVVPGAKGVELHGAADHPVLTSAG